MHNKERVVELSGSKGGDQPDERGLVHAAGETTDPGVTRESRRPVGAIEAIQQRHENKDGLVHAAAETATCFLLNQDGR